MEKKLAAAKMNLKAARGEAGFGKPGGTGPPPKPKDPLKAMGQKSAIKLTLIKVSCYTCPGSHKLWKS